MCILQRNAAPRCSINRIPLGVFDPGVLVGPPEAFWRICGDAMRQCIVAFDLDVPLGANHDTADMVSLSILFAASRRQASWHWRSNAGSGGEILGGNSLLAIFNSQYRVHVMALPLSRSMRSGSLLRRRSSSVMSKHSKFW